MWKKGCHSKNHAKRNKRFLNFAQAFILGDDSEDDEEEPDEEEEPLEDDEIDEQSSSYIAFVHATNAIGITPANSENIIDAGIIDTGSSTLSTVGIQNVAAAIVASSKPTTLCRNETPKRIGGIGAQIETMGNLYFYLFFGGR